MADKDYRDQPFRTFARRKVVPHGSSRTMAGVDWTLSCGHVKRYKSAQEPKQTSRVRCMECPAEPKPIKVKRKPKDPGFIWDFGRERGYPIKQLTHGYLTNFVNNVSDAIAGKEHHRQAKAELQRRANRRGEHQRREPQGMPPGGYPEEDEQ